MKRQRDPAIDVALEYEKSVLAALHELEGADPKKQGAACYRFADAVAALQKLSATDYNKAGTFLTNRGHVPDYAWKKIHAALEIFAAGSDPNAKLN